MDGEGIKCGFVEVTALRDCFCGFIFRDLEAEMNLVASNQCQAIASKTCTVMTEFLQQDITF